MKTIKLIALAILFSLTSCSVDDNPINTTNSIDPDEVTFTSHICKIVYENPWGNHSMNVRIDGHSILTNQATSYEITLNSGQNFSGVVYDYVDYYHPMIAIYVDGVLMKRSETLIDYIIP